MKIKTIISLAGLNLWTGSTPGQGKIPTNWIREKNHDVIAFPELFCDGKGGLNAERKIKLTMGDFYSTRQGWLKTLFCFVDLGPDEILMP